MVYVYISQHDEVTDIFTVHIDGDGVCTQNLPIPGVAVPALIGRYGDPSELVGKVFPLHLP